MSRSLLSPARLAVAAAAAVALGACARSGTGAASTAAAGTATAPEGPLPLRLAPRPTEPAITEADLMTRLYAFADDSMRGREAGTEDNLRGAAFVARELARLGLQPAGENGTWFQDVPFVRREPVADAALAVDGQPLVRGTDWLVVGSRGTLRAAEGSFETVYGGAVAPAATALSREQMAGRLVVIGAPPGGPGAPARLVPEQPLAAAAAVLVTGLEQLTPRQRAAFSAPSTGLASTTAPSAPVPIVVYVTTATAERILGGPLATRAAGTAGRRVEARLRIAEVPVPARNVVAVLPGRDPALRGQYVALGAHNDHIGVQRQAFDHDSLRAANAAKRSIFIALDDDGNDVLTPAQQAEYDRRIADVRVNVDSLRRLRPARPDSIANGADDDGSGSMALLEIAEQLAAAREKPRRSILFVWHTAEEKGLLGARWYATHTTVPRDSIVAQLNIDMIGRGGAGEERHGGPDYVGLVGAGRLSSELDSLVQRTNRAQARPLAFDRALDANGHPQNIYCRSDHAEYARWGIPVAFFFSGLHGDYHQVTDEPQYIDYAHYARITRYIGALTVAVADLERRPAVDQPRQDPNGTCRQ